MEKEHFLLEPTIFNGPMCMKHSNCAFHFKALFLGLGGDAKIWAFNGFGGKIKKKGIRGKGGREKKGKGGREKEKGGRKGKRGEKRGKEKGGVGMEKERKRGKYGKTFQVCPLKAYSPL